jgi:two-component system NtrC family sensor kinase
VDKPHILVVTDNADYAEYLADHLLPGAGYEATRADENTPPPAVDVVLVDVDRVLVSPLGGLYTQRQMGCHAPALLVAPRLNESMAAEIFELNIRDFITKPSPEDHMLDRLKKVLELTELERGQQEIGERLRQQDEMLQRRLSELETLSRVGQALTTVDDVETVLARVVSAAVYLTRAEEGALFMAEERGNLHVRAEKNMGEEDVKVLNALSEDSTAMHVLRTGEPVLQTGEEGQIRVKTGFLVWALVNVPIIIGTQIVGVLAVYNRSQKPFESADLATLAALSDYAALALSKAEAIVDFHGRVHEAAEASRKVFIHTDAMYSPIEAIEIQIEMLLSGSPGPITEAQADALRRIQLSAVRLKEIDEAVRQLAAKYGVE